MAGEAIGTILIVEDEPEIRKLTSMYAEAIGFKVVEAEDGQVAQEVLSKQTFDVILSDMKMPRKDGMTLLKELRDQGDQTPFLFLSAFTSKEYTVQALSLGAFDYLEKPFLPNELKALLYEMLRVSRAQKGALLKAGIVPGTTSGKVSPEAEILRISTLRGETSPSIVDMAASGGIDRTTRLMNIFLNEAQQQMDHGLRALTDLRHTEAPGWQLGYLFRLMNSIKTTAQSLSLNDIRDLAQEMERAYVLLRVRTSYLNKLTLGNLNAAHEVLRRHLDHLASTSPIAPEEVTRLNDDRKLILQDLKVLTPSK